MQSFGVAMGTRYVGPTDVRALECSKYGIPAPLSLRVPYLYVAGDTSLLNEPAIAIVGSRKASPAGRRRASLLAATLAARGFVVMSGLAEGIDEAAHLAAIAAGSTIAVIGTPLSKAYPAKHAFLQETIYRDHLLISPFPEGVRTFPRNFPERNRIMARLAAATVIVEASDTSGSLHQADECIKANRRLFIDEAVYSDRFVSWPARFPQAIVLRHPNEIAEAIG